MTDLAALRLQFMARYSVSPTFACAPGRINLIGEHTDYNAGFVMPAAIQFCTTVGIAPRTDQVLRIHSTNFAESVEVMLPAANALAPRRSAGVHWVDYVVGVARALRQDGWNLQGADLLIHGEVPVGSGLSSSAALEVAVALAFLSLQTTADGPAIDRVMLAKLCQSAENDYVGMRCGIMDQYTSACARAGQALLIDCRSLEREYLPLNSKAQWVIVNSMVRHRLAAGQYNRRREECELGVKILRRAVAEIGSLRDVSSDILAAQRINFKGEQENIIFRRCRHVVSENTRVLDAAVALRAADLDEFGRLMFESHRSLRDDYDVSCEELDLLVRIAEPIRGVYGARMTGGGFGGCTINLVRTDAIDEFKRTVVQHYATATQHNAEVYVCHAADGAQILGL